jgi:phage-related protein
MDGPTRRQRRWRDYRTPSGRRPVNDFLAALALSDRAEIAAAMKDVERNGLSVARHLRGDIYEVRADGDRQTFRILFAPEGRRQTILLALDGFSKKTQKTPPTKIALAERRLRDWRSRGRLSH